MCLTGARLSAAGGGMCCVLGKLNDRDSALRIVRRVANSPNAFRPFNLFSDDVRTKASLPLEPPSTS